MTRDFVQCERCSRPFRLVSITLFPRADRKEKTEELCWSCAKAVIEDRAFTAARDAGKSFQEAYVAAKEAAPTWPDYEQMER